MNSYQIGETVVLKATIKKSDTLYDPATSVKISVYRVGTGTPLVDVVSVTKESTGIYAYNLDTSSYSAAKYRFRFLATDGVKITKKDGAFELEA